MMLGNLVNALAIVIGATIGLIFQGKITKRYETHIIHAMALGVIIIGFLGALAVENTKNILVMLISLAVGAVIGEFVDIERRLTNFSTLLKSKFAIKSDNFVTAFVTATLLYCVGSMAIVGALKSGLEGDHSILIAKGVIDGIISILMASTMGIGIVFSAVVVFLYQGSIVLGSQLISGWLNDVIILDLSIVGSILIIGIGFNMLDLTKLKVGNYLPAILIAPVFTILIGKLYSVLGI